MTALRELPEFALERYFARWEFQVRHLLCASDVEPYGLSELLALADPETRTRWDALRLGYTESPGHPVLRREIAALYETVAPDEVLAFAGAEEGIFLAMHALLGAGDHAVVLWPAYQSLFEVARAVGADVTLVPLDPADWSCDPAAVRAALRRNTRLIVVNFPHSPTGALASRDVFAELLAIANRHGATLFSDEVYRYLEVQEMDRLPAAVDLDPRAVSLGVLSKAFALPGLRIGWIATHDAMLRRRLAALKDYTTICGSAPSEVLAIAALRARDRVLARSRAIIAENLPLLDGFFSRQSGRFAWVRPRGGSIAFPRLRHEDPTCADRLATALVQQEGVLLLPGSQFQYPGNHFRIGFGRRDMPAALAAFESFVERSFDC
ncbi:MAG TPA: aminotransferase class I/II-fold pyridoxal phosphate-dependent enzyme [Gemmatimonadaceae bacterium]|nr:aminotransferase class I/II-fold pyridoxal phosphate-dependent enzyme [Gemmatimonadaceae bacterium]